MSTSRQFSFQKSSHYRQLSEMRSIYFGFWVHVSSSFAFAGSLLVFSNKGQCRIWSDNNYGCTGYSAPFANLNGADDCSDLLTNMESNDPNTLKIDTCRAEDGRQVSWINVNKDSTVSFENQQGDTANCKLNDNLKVGSRCSSDRSDGTQSSSSFKFTTWKL
ncbi:hypothetical protein N7448_011076 [Penicillium atrosanguineum]|nr:hypothetical protein N7448_011076 [Penicillium atrosanguineum]